MSHSAANFLVAMTGLCRAKVCHSHSQKLETSTATAASTNSRGTSQKSGSLRPSKITGLQQLHQLTSVPPATIESLANRLDSVNIATNDHTADLVNQHQMGIAIQALASDHKTHLPWSCVICGQPEHSFMDCTLIQNTPQVDTAC